MIFSDIPLVELHRHLDGSVRLETILELGIQHNLPLPSFDLQELRNHVQVTEPQPGVMVFIEKFKWMVGVLVNYDAVRRIAYENVEDVHNEGLDYVEFRFSPLFMASAHKLDPSRVVEAVVEGITNGVRDFGVHVNLIGILSRTYGPDHAETELEAILKHVDRFVALDLAGDEVNFPASLFVDHFNRARDAGLHITVHAGESSGAESIWQAIRLLKPERLGHAIHAIEDPSLLDYLVSRNISVESCLTSNIQTSCVANYASHPIKIFLEHGIQATINTDDPGISNITLPFEYNFAAPKAGLTDVQIHQAQINSLTAAFMSEDLKRELVSPKRLLP